MTARAIALPRAEALARLATAVSVAFCLVGTAMIANGIVVPLKAVVAQRLLERVFERSRKLHRPQRPWPWADMAPVARLTVARLHVGRIVLDSGSGQAMAFGPTLLPGGAVVGRPGTVVIAAHRDTHFAFLRDLRPGDLVSVQAIDGRAIRYRVIGAEVVRWDRFAVPREDDRQLLALATCYPFSALGHGPLRYVVWAAQSQHRVAPSTGIDRNRSKS